MYISAGLYHVEHADLRTPMLFLVIQFMKISRNTT